ncbi:hypothetical protein ACFQZE_06315 [Paenibacillus sp. GCM10027627]|uniref:hypothetical protein n=1 Tax=unclassified Paenibacillus TaxID=185978 RepID=UPI0036456E41
MITLLIIFSVLYLGIGVWSLIFYINDFVIVETKENKFDGQMIIVMLMALFVSPLYWFLRYIFKHSL